MPSHAEVLRKPDQPPNRLKFRSICRSRARGQVGFPPSKGRNRKDMGPLLLILLPLAVIVLLAMLLLRTILPQTPFILLRSKSWTKRMLEARDFEALSNTASGRRRAGWKHRKTSPQPEQSLEMCLVSP